MTTHYKRTISANSSLVSAFLVHLSVEILFASAFQSVENLGIFVFNPPLILFALYMNLFVVNAIFWPSTISFLTKNTTQISSAFGGFILTVNVVRALGPTIDGFLITYFPSNYLLIFVFGFILSLAACVTFSQVKEKQVLNAYISGGAIKYRFNLKMDVSK